MNSNFCSRVRFFLFITAELGGSLPFSISIELVRCGISSSFGAPACLLRLWRASQISTRLMGVCALCFSVSGVSGTQMAHVDNEHQIHRYLVNISHIEHELLPPILRQLSYFPAHVWFSKSRNLWFALSDYSRQVICRLSFYLCSQHIFSSMFGNKRKFDKVRDFVVNFFKSPLTGFESFTAVWSMAQWLSLRCSKSFVPLRRALKVTLFLSRRRRLHQIRRSRMKMKLK